MTDGEKRARVLFCKQLEVVMDRLHADAWYTAQNARTANVVEVARTLTAFTTVFREFLREFEREALDGLPAVTLEEIDADVKRGDARRALGLAVGVEARPRVGVAD